MSSLKLLHSGGNGVIIAAPSSNPAANRTITLNDNYAGDGSFVTANSSGNVGIGTSSPDQPLHIKSNTPYIKFEDDNDNQDWQIEARAFFSIYDVTDSAHRLAIDGDGNVGIGTTSPASKLHVDGANSGGAIVTIHNTAGSSSADAGLEVETSTTGAFTQRWLNAGTELARVAGSGHFMIRTTSTGTDNSNSANFNTDGYLTLNHINTESSGRAYLAFNYNAGEIGTVTQSGTSGVSYNTSSDYRLKENIVEITDGITRLKTLKPSRFNFKTEKDRTVDGFIAHEVTAVPEAVTGTKDEVDSDNKPIYQGIDQSKLVPLLTAALQEEVAKREALEARVAALEGA